MLKFTKMSLAAALLASTASVAVAQGLDLDVGAGAGASAGDSGMSTGINMDAGANIDLTNDDGATVTIAANEDGSMAIDGITSEDQVKLVVRSDLMNDSSYSGQIFADADARGAAHLDDIQSRVEANATLVAALDSRGFDSDDVMAVRSTTDGNVVLFIDDQA